MSSNSYDFNLGAAVGATQLFSVTGRQASISSASGGPVEILTNTGKKFRCLEAQGFKLDAEEPDFQWLQVRNLAALSNIGTIFIGDDDFLDRRLGGTVKVADDSVTKTRAGLQFIGSIFQSASVGNVSVVGVARGSANRFAVRRMTISSSTAGTVQLFMGTGVGTATPTVGQAKNKFLGQADSPMNITQGFAVTYPLTAAELPGFAYLANVQIGANTPFVWDMPNGPIYIEGSNVLCVAPGGQNRDIQVVFDLEQVLV